MTLALSQIAGSYNTFTIGHADQFSPLIVNDDGSLVIAGTLVSATYAPATGVLTILPAAVNGQVISGTITFGLQPSGNLRFAGILSLGASAAPFVSEDVLQVEACPAAS